MNAGKARAMQQKTNLPELAKQPGMGPEMYYAIFGYVW